MARKAIDAVRSAYQAKRRSLVVPEWGDLEIYFGPLSIDDMESIERRVKDKDSRYERSVLLLIHKARDKEGKPLFEFGDKKVLEAEADVTVLNRIVAFMWEGVPDMDAARRELEGNPLSDSE